MGVLSNIYSGTTGYSGRGPSAVQGTALANEGFQLQKPFLEDLFGSASDFYYDTTTDDAGEETISLKTSPQYQGETIAPFTSEQERAFNMLTDIGSGGLASTGLAGAGQYMERAKGLGELAGGTFDTATARQYMNPYIDNVTRQAEDEVLRRYQTEIEPRIGAEAAAANAYGGSRAAIMESEAQRNLQRQMGDIRERGLAASFDQGRRAFESQKDRERGLASFYGQLAESAPRIGATEAGLVSSVGEQRRAFEQTDLDRAQREFIERRDDPIRNLAGYQSILQGFPYSPSTYEVETKYSPQPSFGQTLLGTLGTGASLYGAFGGFNPAGNRKRGGLVRRRSGGQIQGGLAGLERHQNNGPRRLLPNTTLSKQIVNVLGQEELDKRYDKGLRQFNLNLDKELKGIANRRRESRPLPIRPGLLSWGPDSPLISDEEAKAWDLQFRDGLDKIERQTVAYRRNPTPKWPTTSEYRNEVQRQIDKYGYTYEDTNYGLGAEQGDAFKYRQPARRPEKILGSEAVAVIDNVKEANLKKKEEKEKKLNQAKLKQDKKKHEAEVNAFISDTDDPDYVDEREVVAAIEQDDGVFNETAELLSPHSGAKLIDIDGAEPIDIGGFSISGIIEGGRKYDDALDAYRKLLEAKDPEELRTKADEAQRQKLWLTAAKFFSKMGSSAPSSIGMSGFSSILEAAMKSAPDSIDEVNKIQKQFREEIALADKLKEDVTRETVTLEQARELMRLKRWGIGKELLDARTDLIKAGEFDHQAWSTGIKAMEGFVGKLGIDSKLRKEIMHAFALQVRVHPTDIPKAVEIVQKEFKDKTAATGQKKEDVAANTKPVTIPGL